MPIKTHRKPATRRARKLTTALSAPPGAQQRPPRSPDIAKGQKIAIAMLSELEDDGERVDRCFLDPEDRNAGHARGYENAVLLSLQEARRQGPECEEGFTMVLSDFIASVCGSVIVHSDYYDRLTERRVIEPAAASEPKGAA
jgi:hypothetical protein